MASSENKIHEVIVIGGGLMGSSVAWHLSNYGKAVLVIEKQGEIYDSGSSKGEARIVRSTNIENDELWSYLHNRSIKEVELLIAFLNSQGHAIAMEDIYSTSPISYIAKLKELDQLLENLKNQEVNYEVASSIEEGTLKFGVNLKKGTFLQREYNKYSGTLNPKKLITSLHKAIALKGNQIRYHTKVKRIEKEKDFFSISVVDSNGKSDILFAKQVISAAGPYTGQLLKNIAPYFKKLIHPKRVFLVFLKIKDAYYQDLSESQKLLLKSGFPVIDKSIDLQSEEFFAMIEKQDLQGNLIIKIGGHHQRSAISALEKVWEAKLSVDEINWAVEKTLRYLNILNLPVNADQIEVVDEYSCVYSLTESEVPFVTPIRSSANSIDQNFIVIAGLSGVGAKGAMTYGLIGANLLTNSKLEDNFYKTAVAKLGYERLETKTL